MRETVNCLREYKGLPEGDQPAYLIRMGAALTTNTATFPDIPFAGTVITANAPTLLTKFGLKDTSDAAMLAYTTLRDLMVTKVEANYDDIDLVAQGDGAIVAQGGVRGTSVNTTRIGTPPVASDLKFSISEHANQMIISHAFEKLATGSVYITFIDPSIIVEYAGDTQLKITVGTDRTVILIDLDTASKTVIKNVLKKTEIITIAALFNSNGISPLSNPISMVVPK